ncbi:integral membrane sensor signal transduction histidine kinase [Alkaliphilus oremlandii OhILAs]|uniref:histidine kinase n=1 Tax=Alkaliphilus oremlandii (strain OhILAs) TaxID=350688 RepID=A8MKX7_ALKOO|nr:integral membrane sensor signal transduction histidine kinase [Alkaliphilus oremlandii OhILAs]
MRRVVFFIRQRVEKSIRIQLMANFVICLISSMLVASISATYLARLNRNAIIDYSEGIERIDYSARRIVENLNDYRNEFYDLRIEEERLEAEYPEDAEESSQSADMNLGSNSLAIESENSGTDTSQDGTVDSSVQDSKVNLMGKIESEFKVKFKEYIGEVLNEFSYGMRALIVDLDGDVLYRSENATESKVDIHSIIRNAMNTRIDFQRLGGASEFTSFYPINLNDTRAYIVVSGVPEARIEYNEGQIGFIPIVLGFANFVLLFYFSTQKKMRYIEELADGLLEISKGNLDHRIAGKSEDELGSLANNINFMAEALQTKIEEERAAEMLKNELITNVSHDLRTPLTSIMGYLNLLKDKRYETEEEAYQYLNIAYGKSEKLKDLIQDLFEYAKLTNEGVKLNLSEVHLNSLIDQLTEELVPILDEKQLSFKKDISKEDTIVLADADKMVRVFENLLTNAIRHSSVGTEILVQTSVDEDNVIICVENTGEPISSEYLERIFDRFFKVEKSRTSNSAGSGLGLAISKNIINLHKGSIWAESEGNIVRFYVRLSKFKSMLN